MNTTRFDYIVVGGGSAGVAAAARLAWNGAGTVGLLEAGPSDRDVDAIRQLPQWQSLLGGRYDYDYAIEPQPRGNSSIRHSRGRMLGGCSSHNSCIAFVPPDSDFVAWAEIAGDAWSAGALRTSFRRVLDVVNLEPTDPTNAAVEAFIRAGEQMGLPRSTFSSRFSDSVGLFQLNKRGTLRESSSVAYLHNREPLPENLTVLTGVSARRLLFGSSSSTRVTGVATDEGDYTAEKEVVLSAGAFDTPKLLLLSGVGPAEELARHGIEVRLDLPGVGENLLDHPEGVILWESEVPVPRSISNVYEAGLFATVDSDAVWPDLMFHFGTQAFDMHTVSAGYPTSENAISMTPNVTRARSRGFVRLRSSDPVEAPLIDFRYFSDPDGYDERIMVAGIRRAREIAAQPAMRSWAARELAPGAGVQTDEEISEYVRRTANTVYHPVGTCRLGHESDPEAVVDPALRVRGVERLRIADASVFPTIPSVNPNLTCMAIGERCAELLTAERSAT